jgi:signal peptidase II
MNIKTENRIWHTLALFGVLFGLDRISKHLILKTACDFDITSFLSFDLTMNRGIAWGIFHTVSGFGFIMVTSMIMAIISILIWYAWQQLRKGHFAVAEMVILAGATSNLYDRLLYSGVIDFINFHFGSWSFPIFNLADIYIVVGVIWILCTQYDK